jgi:hypothetical protein
MHRESLRIFANGRIPAALEDFRFRSEVSGYGWNPIWTVPSREQEHLPISAIRESKLFMEQAPILSHGRVDRGSKNIE